MARLRCFSWRDLADGCLQIGAQPRGREVSLVQSALCPVSTPGRLAEGQEQLRWTLLSGLDQHFAVPFARELADLQVHLMRLPFLLAVAAPPVRAALQ
jgi:hypothetical protein